MRATRGSRGSLASSCPSGVSVRSSVTALSSVANGQQDRKPDNWGYGFLEITGGYGAWRGQGFNGGIDFGIPITTDNTIGFGISFMGNNHNRLSPQYRELEKVGVDLSYTENSLYLVHGIRLYKNLLIIWSAGCSFEELVVYGDKAIDITAHALNPDLPRHKVAPECYTCPGRGSDSHAEPSLTLIERRHFTYSLGLKYIGMPTFGLEFDNRRGMVFSLGVGGTDTTPRPSW